MAGYVVMQGFLPLLLVTVAVALSIASAIVLKEAVQLVEPTMLVLFGLLALVVLINVFRVVFWAAIHRRYRLSDSYPLTALFFPMILLVSILYGEEISAYKVLGTLLITIGVAFHVGNGAQTTVRDRTTGGSP